MLTFSGLRSHGAFPMALYDLNVVSILFTRKYIILLDVEPLEYPLSLDWSKRLLN